MSEVTVILNLAHQGDPTAAGQLLALFTMNVNEALEKLDKEEAKAAEIAKLRFFGGLTLEEAAQVLGVTKRTADRYWAFARVWLFDEMRLQYKS